MALIVGHGEPSERKVVCKGAVRFPLFPIGRFDARPRGWEHLLVLLSPFHSCPATHSIIYLFPWPVQMSKSQPPTHQAYDLQELSAKKTLNLSGIKYRNLASWVPNEGPLWLGLTSAQKELTSLGSFISSNDPACLSPTLLGEFRLQPSLLSTQ